jgi:hypothetical protein
MGIRSNLLRDASADLARGGFRSSYAITGSLAADRAAAYA